jgi:hypothetical protein
LRIKKTIINNWQKVTHCILEEKSSRLQGTIDSGNYAMCIIKADHNNKGTSKENTHQTAK